MANQTKIYEAIDVLKDAVFEEVQKSPKEGVSVKTIAERLSLRVAGWPQYEVDGHDLTWSLLAILEKEGEIIAKGSGGEDRNSVVIYQRGPGGRI